MNSPCKIHLDKILKEKDYEKAILVCKSIGKKKNLLKQST